MDDRLITFVGRGGRQRYLFKKGLLTIKTFKKTSGRSISNFKVALIPMAIEAVAHEDI